MIKKKRTVPLRILQAGALLRRLPKHHKKWTIIYDSYNRRKSGYEGEKSMDYQLKFLTRNNYNIYQGLRLPGEDNDFQLDTFVVTSQFAVIIEVKNISGTLKFDKASGQLIRITETKEEGFQDPIPQVKRQRFELQRWMHHHKLPSIPIEYLVGISNPSTLIKTSENNHELFQVLSHVDKIPEKITKMQEKYKQEVMDSRTLGVFNRFLLEENHPTSEDILAIYDVTPQELIKGVMCPRCLAPMNRSSGYWICRSCHERSQDAHKQAIEDYFLLVRPTITNRQCCNFLQLNNRKMAWRLLSEMNLNRTGTGKGVVYHKGEPNENSC
ncbi:nuclease-related domain-containing protein [Tuberibacillus sp. Marseille-P3662]|uniref:nuclease-related domain-containing protein n=1 Tax=Tuberibacillus sp. Marseille-P3662 TaxID=1965358 RepID=UPI000A1CE270|nr:nuclease-related domain-containing protein [Tuberibacillus sp. Marseille-P3662]